MNNLSTAWKKALVVYSTGFLVIFYQFYQTYLSMFDIWNRSGTFSHCFLILPICFYLIYKRKSVILNLTPTTNIFGFVFLVGTVFLWYVGGLVDAQIVQHLAIVLVFPFLTLFIFGWKIVKIIIFPLSYSLFMVPFGEVFILPMMEMTAVFTVQSIKILGIPVYSDGLFFELPSGNWSVVEGCSGVRYLIASIALGTLYAYISFNSLLKRLLFVVAAIIVPIVGNWIRAMLIVLIAHYSNMKLAVGVDHLLYGWVFFGLLMLLLFYFGGYWREPPKEIHVVERSTNSYQIRGAVCGVLLLLLFSQWSYKSVIKTHFHSYPNFEVKYNNKILELYPDDLRWQPSFESSDLSRIYTLPVNGKKAYLWVLWYSLSPDSGKLVSSVNTLVPQKHSTWKSIKREVRKSVCPGGSETSVFSHEVSYQVLSWYQISGKNYCKPVNAKFAQLISRIKGSTSQGARLLVVIEDDYSQSDITLLSEIAKNIDLEVRVD